MNNQLLDGMRNRQSKRLSNDILKPVEVHSLDDIKRVVAQLDPHKNIASAEVPVATTLMAENEAGEHLKVQLSANTKSKSKREILIEGLDIIKRWVENKERMLQSGVATEVDGISMRPAMIGDVSKGATWVDRLIMQWLGGFRNGTYICWDLNDGFLYKYDIYAHKLSRTEQSQPSNAGTV